MITQTITFTQSVTSSNWTWSRTSFSKLNFPWSNFYKVAQTPYQTMLHILSLLLLPCLLSTAEASGVFLYLCFGEGCSGWDIALTCLSILFTMCCLVSAFASCCKGRAKEEEDFQTETVWRKEQTIKRKYAPSPLYIKVSFGEEDPLI